MILLNDQFIFGIHNKEIQDHLLGEISETDNSVKSLYEARKIESKLEQRKMLGIVTPDRLVDVNAVKRIRSDSTRIAITVDIVMVRETALLMANIVTIVVERTILQRNANIIIMMLNQIHATGPEVRVTMTKSVNLVANIRKISTQLKWTQIVKVAVLVIATKWRI